MTNVTTLDVSNFGEFMGSAGAVKVVRFWATWCRPCIALEPVYAEVASELGKSASFADVDIDKAPEVAGQFGIRSVPTVLVFKDGEPVEVVVGLHQKAKYVEVIKKAS